MGDDIEVDLPVGETGTVYFAGGREFEYHNDPEKTDRMTNRQGWRTLGDVGHLDADGYLYLTDRAADIVISGGREHLSPRRPNRCSPPIPRSSTPPCSECPTRRWESRCWPWSRGNPAMDRLTAADLLAWCRDRLAGYKCPEAVQFIAEMPRDPSGKLFKRLLREPYWNDRTSRIV